jgi:hypothetical protein
MKRSVIIGAAAIAIGVLAGGGTAMAASASIPDPSGVIYSCYDTGGNLKVIDTATTASCPKGYTGLNWNQQGQQGPAGIQGATGPQGPAGPTGPAGPAGQNGTNGQDGTNGVAGIHIVREPNQIADGSQHEAVCPPQPGGRQTVLSITYQNFSYDATAQTDTPQTYTNSPEVDVINGNDVPVGYFYAAFGGGLYAAYLTCADVS